MARFVKRYVALFLAVMMVLSTAATTFAAVGSTQSGIKWVNSKGSHATDGSKVNTYKVKKASLVTAKAAATVKVPATITYKKAPYKLVRIKAYAFKKAGKKATKIDLGKNVVRIEHDAFNNCKKLKTLVIRSTKKPTISKNAFRGLNTKNITIKVTNLSKSDFNALKKSLQKNGFKGKIKNLKK